MTKILKNNIVEDSIIIDSETPGPHVIIMGGIHGDEISGPLAIEKFLYDIVSEFRTLEKGKITFVRGNRIALEKRERFVKYNLNRLFKDNYNEEYDDCYEYNRAQELKVLLRNCDYLLDLHTAPITQEPFVFAENKSLDFFKTINYGKIITGWGNFPNSIIAGDTETYATTHGAIACTYEAGSHFEISSIDNAYNAILQLLAKLEMTDFEINLTKPAEVFELYEIYTKKGDDFRYLKEYTNFDLIKKEEAFAFENGNEVIANEDFYILLPNDPKKAKVSEKLFYFGKINK